MAAQKSFAFTLRFAFAKVTETCALVALFDMSRSKLKLEGSAPHPVLKGLTADSINVEAGFVEVVVIALLEPVD